MVIVVGYFTTMCYKPPDLSDCVTCKKRSGGYTTPGGDVITTYTTRKACSDEEVRSLEKDGWSCAGYLGFDWSCVDLLSPHNYEKYVNIPAQLAWDKYINFFPDLITEITYDVYLSRDSVLDEPFLRNIIEESRNISLLSNTTYYWKVVAKNKDEALNESEVRCFTTRPVINYGTFTDSRDGNRYKTIIIDSQTWMAENLKYEIPGKQITDGNIWENNSSCDGWCYYNNDKDSLGQIYGILYQMEAAKNACPAGWHLPSYAEWDVLYDLLIPNTGRKLRETGTQHWNISNYSSNSTGFTALPGGIRMYNSAFKDVGKSGYWWSAPLRALTLTAYIAYIDNMSESYGCSVRCIKD
jgi:uncharacterized protein (TIGR02145 family)